MNNMRIKLTRPLSNKIQFVKTIKTFSGMGLKEGKDLCDEMHDNINVYYNINIEVGKKEEFIKEIKELFGDDVVVNDVVDLVDWKNNSFKWDAGDL